MIRHYSVQVQVPPLHVVHAMILAISCHFRWLMSHCALRQADASFRRHFASADSSH
jgi:hypothetical protein